MFLESLAREFFFSVSLGDGRLPWRLLVASPFRCVVGVGFEKPYLLRFIDVLDSSIF